MMARISITGLISLILMVAGFGIIWTSVQPLLTPLVGGSWLIGILLGIVLVIIATFLGRRRL